MRKYVLLFYQSYYKILKEDIMDKQEITVVICCAGMGTRLGIGSTKALISIDEKPLIIRILELLDDYDDIRIVVGYQAERVIQVVTEYRKDIMFAFNYDFATTGIAESFRKALPCSRKYVVEIDGDLLINASDFRTFMNYSSECLGIGKVKSGSPIYVQIEGEHVIEFLTNAGNYEWTGLVKMETKKVNGDGHYIYQVIEPFLPIACVEVRAIDIDTSEDYEKALQWFDNGCIE